jgi:hypothetical protein
MKNPPPLVALHRMYGWYVTNSKNGRRVAEEDGFRESDVPVRLYTDIGDAWAQARRRFKRRGPELVHVTVPPSLYLDLRGIERREKPEVWKGFVDGVIRGSSKQHDPLTIDYLSVDLLKPSPIRIVD